MFIMAGMSPSLGFSILITSRRNRPAFRVGRAGNVPGEVVDQQTIQRSRFALYVVVFGNCGWAVIPAFPLVILPGETKVFAATSRLSYGTRGVTPNPDLQGGTCR